MQKISDLPKDLGGYVRSSEFEGVKNDELLSLHVAF